MKEEDIHTPVFDGLSASEIRALADGLYQIEIIKLVRRRTGLAMPGAVGVVSAFISRYGRLENNKCIFLRDEPLEWATR